MLVAAVCPSDFQSFVIFQLTQVIIYGLAILGLNLLTGFNGQFSLGHSAFYGIGAYVAAILMHNYGVAYYWTVPAAGGVCFVVGFLFGLPALRLQNLYLALATFALAIAMPQILKFHGLEDWTGGVQGLVVDQPDVPGFLPIDGDQWLYYFTLAVVLFMFAAAANLIRSRSGRAIMAIRDNPIAAAAMGDQQAVLQDADFWRQRALHRDRRRARRARRGVCRAGQLHDFPVDLAAGRPGDRRRRLDPRLPVRRLFVLYVPNIANSVSTGLAGVIYGVILLLVVFVMPAGAAGFARCRRAPVALAQSVKTVELRPHLTREVTMKKSDASQHSRRCSGRAGLGSPLLTARPARAASNTAPGSPTARSRSATPAPTAARCRTQPDSEIDGRLLQDDQRPGRHERPQDHLHLL